MSRSPSSKMIQSSDKSISKTLTKLGLSSIYKISKSLQGAVWRGKYNNEKLVIKVTNCHLQEQSLAHFGNNKLVPVDEDIISEAMILKYLSQDSKCPKSIVKYGNFFKSLSKLTPSHLDR